MAVLALVGVAVFVFYANEARKEINFLCGNFITGTDYASVISQLDTANLSSYKVHTNLELTKIVFSSQLHFHYVSCTIDFDNTDRVVTAEFTPK